MLSWVDEDISTAVDGIEEMFTLNNIELKHLRIGYGFIKEPVEALQYATLYSHGRRPSLVPLSP